MFLILKFPQHLALDYSIKNIIYSTKYWAFGFIDQNSWNLQFQGLLLSRFFLIKNTIKSDFLTVKKFIKLTLRNESTNFSWKKNKSFFKKFLKNRPKVKHKSFYSKIGNKAIYNSLFNNSKYNTNYIRRFLIKFSCDKTLLKATFSFFNFFFDINFLKKEKIYTKLKYSRVPQYDIVSGASAALLAGFLGFLICEKFGFELLDSGDFYFLFMYLVFLFFSLRLFIKLLSIHLSNWSILSLKWFIYFYLVLVNFIDFQK